MRLFFCVEERFRMHPNFVGVTGLPRAGSTLLCIRRSISDDSFFLAQLDNAFESSYAHLASAMRGFLHGWHHDCRKKTVVDKNRAWLHAIELLLQIEPDAKL